MINLVHRASLFESRVAVRDDEDTYTYRQLLHKSEKIALNLLTGQDDLHEARIAFMVNPGFEYVAIQWGIWRAGGIAVPLCVKHPYL
ncbi:MAG: AMP-binding protein, partial [Saprospiraceae bacterium]|nr:AMP-binding protein [Saprospiraceae bacterium]